MASGRDSLNLSEEVERLARRGEIEVFEAEGRKPIDISEEIEKSSGNIKEITGLQKAGLSLARLILWAISSSLSLSSSQTGL